MDNYGTRPLLAGTLALFALSLVLRPMMTELWHFYALSFIQFFAFSGMNMLPAGRLVALWFPKSKGRAMGFTTMGNNFGGLTVPMLTGYLLAVATWGTAFVVTGILAFAVALLAALFVHERTPHRSSSLQGSGSSPTTSGLAGLTVKEALRSDAFYYVTVATALGSFTYSALLPQISTHLLDQGTPDATVVTLLSLLAAFGMAGKGIFGYLAERFTARVAMMLSLGGQTVLISVIVAYPIGVHLWVIVPIFGFFFGAYGVLMTLLVQENFGLKNFGSISGLSGLAGMIAAVSGPLMAGASYDYLGSYGPAFVAVAALFATAILLLTRVKSPMQRLAEMAQE